MSPTVYIKALVLLGGGIALFLMGSGMCSEGLQRSSGPKMRALLARLSTHRVKSALAATMVSTLLLNGPTSVVILSYVNAGILSLAQAIPMIFGANLGTTFSMQIAAFHVGEACFGILLVGLVMSRWPRVDLVRHLGMVISGFGLIFLGQETMKLAIGPLKDSAVITGILGLYHSGGWGGFTLALLAGAGLTALFQSSSVMVSLLFSLAGLGLLHDFRAAIPFVLGAHIGSCMMTVFAATGGTAAAWRTAISQIVFNIIGAIIAAWMLPFYEWFIPTLSSDAARQIANFNTIKQVITLAMLLPFTGLMERFVVAITRRWLGDREEEHCYLDAKLLDRPEAAILASTKELQRQARIVDRMLRQSLDGLVSLDLNQFRPISVEERAVDLIKYEVQNYVARIGQRNLSARQALMLQRLILASNAIERIGDHIEDIGHLCREKVENDIWFEDAHMERLLHLSRLVCDMHATAMRALDPTDPDSHELGAAVLRQRIEFKRQSKALKQLVDESMHGCNVSTGLFFLRFLTVIDKIVSHLKAVARQESREDYSIEDAQMLQIEQLAPKPAGRPANHPLHATFEDALRDLPPP